MGRKDKPVPQQNIGTDSVGPQLRIARESRKIKLTDMAHAIDYTVGYLSGVENRIHKAPEGLIHKYEVVLGLNPGELNDFIQAYQENRPTNNEPMWHVPSRNPFFTGREDILKDIHSRLWSRERSPCVLAIAGLSGVGKTQLSVEYIYRYSNKYRTVFWFEADSFDFLAASCVELAKDKDLREKDAPDRDATVRGVQRWLREEKPGSLIILNNVEDLESLHGFITQLNESNIIITTRIQAVGPIAQTIILAEMDSKESVLLLLRRAKILSPDATPSTVPETTLTLAEEITKIMAGLPIALDQAGSYLEKTGCGLSDYLNLLQTYQEKTPNQSIQQLSPYPTSVSATWLLLFEEVKKIDPLASDLLCLCAFLGADKIHHRELLAQALSSVEPTLHTLATDPFRLHQAVSVLRNYSLVRTDGENGALFVHRLVQAALRDSLSPATQLQWAESAVKVMNQAFPEIKVEEWSKLWTKCQRYFPQADACITLANTWEVKNGEMTQLLRKVGRYLEERTQTREAEEAYLHALKLDKQYYGEYHTSTATDLGCLATLYEKQGRTTLAENLYDQAFSIYERTVKPESSDIAVLTRYIKLLQPKAKQEDKIEKVSQYINMLQSNQKRPKRTPINDDDSNIDYQKKEDWLYEERRTSGDYNSDIHISHTKGSSFEYTFEGTGIEILSDTLSAQGEIDIYIDNTYIQTTNISRIPDKQTQTIVFSKTDLEFGSHELKVELVNGAFILDALGVYSYEEDVLNKNILHKNE